MALAHSGSVGDALAPAAGLTGLAGLPGKQELGKNENIDSVQALLLGSHGTEASEQTHHFEGRIWICCAWGKPRAAYNGKNKLSTCV